IDRPAARAVRVGHTQHGEREWIALNIATQRGQMSRVDHGTYRRHLKGIVDIRHGARGTILTLRDHGYRITRGIEDRIELPDRTQQVSILIAGFHTARSEVARGDMSL